jgi:dihydrodipicolinate reductase
VIISGHRGKIGEAVTRSIYHSDNPELAPQLSPRFTNHQDITFIMNTSKTSVYSEMYSTTSHLCNVTAVKDGSILFVLLPTE